MELLLTIVLFLWLFFWLLKRILPWLLVRWVQRRSSPSSGRTAAGRRGARSQEGEVFVSGEGRPGDKVIGKDMGEYVDFDEVPEREDLN